MNDTMLFLKNVFLRVLENCYYITNELTSVCLPYRHFCQTNTINTSFALLLGISLVFSSLVKSFIELCLDEAEHGKPVAHAGKMTKLGEHICCK